MTDLNFPWWFVVLAYLYFLGPWTGLGAVTGFALAYLPLSASARRDGRASVGKLGRIRLSLLAALAAGAVTFFVALRIYTGC